VTTAYYEQGFGLRCYGVSVYVDVARRGRDLPVLKKKSKYSENGHIFVNGDAFW